MTTALKQAREWSESLQRASTALSGEAEGFLICARQNCALVEHLLLIWTVMMHRLRCGGTPTQMFLEECEQLLTLAGQSDNAFNQIARVWRQRPLPEDLAEPIHAQVVAARDQLAALMRHVQQVQGRVPRSQRVTANPEELKQQLSSSGVTK